MFDSKCDFDFVDDYQVMDPDWRERAEQEEGESSEGGEDSEDDEESPSLLTAEEKTGGLAVGDGKKKT
jgi:hypothetical protein